MSHKRLILIISLLLPIAVSGLYFMPKFSLNTVDFLPLFNACVNGGVFLILIYALVAIKKGKRQLHMKLMYSALILSIIFLISYVLHHATHATRPHRHATWDWFVRCRVCGLNGQDEGLCEKNLRD